MLVQTGPVELAEVLVVVVVCEELDGTSVPSVEDGSGLLLGSI